MYQNHPTLVHSHPCPTDSLSGLAELAVGVVHDINNALPAVFVYADLLGPMLADDATATEYLRDLTTAARHIKGVMARFHARVRHVVCGGTESFNMSEAVEDALLLTKPHWKLDAEADGLSLELASDLPKLPLAEGDREQFVEIVINLVRNAVDAIYVAHQHDRDKRHRLHITVSQISPRHLCLRVSDSGCGMSAATRAICTAPLFTTKAGGTGMGLAVVSELIEQVGGWLQITSQPDQGTTVTVVYPLAAVTTPCPAP